MHFILDALFNRNPDEFGLAVKVWSNRAIRTLMRREDLAPVTATAVSLWMRLWGFRGPRPSLDVIGEYDDEVSASAIWRLQEYPRIRRLARKHNARVLLFDERPLPQTPFSARRLPNMLCAIDGRGTLYFSVAYPPVTAGKRTDFMNRLVLDIGRPVFLLLDSHPNHENGAIRKWQRDAANGITLFHIPITALRELPAECMAFWRCGSRECIPSATG